MKIITNEEFLNTKKKYKKVMEFTRYKYRAMDDYLELKQLADIALWRTLAKYDSSLSTFSNYLIKNIRWTFLTNYRKQKKHKLPKLVNNININNTSTILIDILDALKESDVEVFLSRFILNMTLREIAKNMNTNVTHIVEIIDKIKKVIKKDLT